MDRYISTGVAAESASQRFAGICVLGCLVVDKPGPLDARQSRSLPKCGGAQVRTADLPTSTMVAVIVRERSCLGCACSCPNLYTTKQRRERILRPTVVFLSREQVSCKGACRASRPQLCSQQVEALAFQPYEDICAVGLTGGMRSMVVPGAGLANFDSFEANPYETAKVRRSPPRLSS